LVLLPSSDKDSQVSGGGRAVLPAHNTACSDHKGDRYCEHVREPLAHVGLSRQWSRRRGTRMVRADQHTREITSTADEPVLPASSVYCNAAHGRGHARERTAAVVDRHVRRAHVAGIPVLHAVDCGVGRRGLRPIRGRPLSPVLCGGHGAAEFGGGPISRLLLVGYFEGIDAVRGIAWRAADSLAVRSFVRLGLEDVAPDHSTISRTRRLIDLETHRVVFTCSRPCADGSRYRPRSLSPRQRPRLVPRAAKGRLRH